MQKFTVFSILLSLAVILAIGDIIFHAYLKGESSSSEQSSSEADVPIGVEEEINEPEEIEEEGAQAAPDGAVGAEPAASAAVDLSEESDILEPSLSLELFEEAGFTSPVLKDTLFSGLVFQFISFSDQNEASIYQWNLFDGEQYIGSIYQVQYATETGSFQGYLALRERASGLTQLGTINEVNNYGDASFYFNHKTKVKTTHLIFRSGPSIYAFEYSKSYHDKMKEAFDRISSLL